MQNRLGARQAPRLSPNAWPCCAHRRPRMCPAGPQPRTGCRSPSSGRRLRRSCCVPHTPRERRRCCGSSPSR
ncbi:hypothetical protein ACFPRL_00985 [Pseudoclavibacter helvolus]